MKAHKLPNRRAALLLTLSMLLALAACGGPANDAVGNPSDASIRSESSQSGGDVSSGDVAGGTVYFDGKTWQRMDPTFASSDNNSDAIIKYIGDGANYDAKYFY